MPAGANKQGISVRFNTNARFQGNPFLAPTAQKAKKGTGYVPVPFKSFSRISCFGIVPYFVPLGINRGEVRPVVIASKISTRLVKSSLAVVSAGHPPE
jgi:hypothetical protein